VYWYSLSDIPDSVAKPVNFCLKTMTSLTVTSNNKTQRKVEQFYSILQFYSNLQKNKTILATDFYSSLALLFCFTFFLHDELEKVIGVWILDSDSTPTWTIRLLFLF